MKKVIVLGAGGHAAEIDEYIRHTQRVTLKRDLKIVGFLDDNANNYSKYAFSALPEEYKIIRLAEILIISLVSQGLSIDLRSLKGLKQKVQCFSLCSLQCLYCDSAK